MSEIKLTLSNTDPGPSISSGAAPPPPSTDLILSKAAQALIQQAEDFSPEECEQIAQLTAEITLTDYRTIASYGYNLQNKLTTTTESSLSLTQRDLSEVGTLFSQMRAAITRFDQAAAPSGLSGLFRSSRQHAVLQECFAETSEEIQRIKKELDGWRLTLLVDVRQLEDIYRQLSKYYKQLSIYIRAGRDRLTDVEAQDPKEISSFHDYQSKCHAFMARLNDLETSKTIYLQSALQTQLFLHIDRQLILQIENHLTNSIAIWQQSIATALTVANSQQVLRPSNTQLITSIDTAINIQKDGTNVKSLTSVYQQTS